MRHRVKFQGHFTKVRHHIKPSTPIERAACVVINSSDYKITLKLVFIISVRHMQVHTDRPSLAVVFANKVSTISCD